MTSWNLATTAEASDSSSQPQSIQETICSPLVEELVWTAPRINRIRTRNKTVPLLECLKVARVRLQVQVHPFLVQEPLKAVYIFDIRIIKSGWGMGEVEIHYYIIIFRDG